MRIAICETEDWTNFLPLTYTRAGFELRCGVYSFVERLSMRFHGDGPMLFARSYLAGTLKRKHPGLEVNNLAAIDDDLLVVSATLLPSQSIDLLLQRNKGKNFVVMKEGAVALAFLKEAKAKEVAATLKAPLGASFSKSIRAFAQAVDGEGLELLRYPWGIIEKNAELIREDFKAHPRDSQSTLDTSVHVEGGKENLLVGEKTFVEGGVVIDVRDGPVWIGDDVYVQAPSRISGPTYVGDGSIIFGAQLREGTSIGRVCRIGGEVEETVFQAYSNKRHVGFIGHAYVGEWVNMGSGTQNSDLKNTYGTVKVTIGGKKVDTGKAFVGCVIGDHAKMSIGSQIFTGKTVGVSSQALGTVIEDIPSFTIWGKTLGMGAVELRIDSAVETARRVQARRKVELTKDDEELLRKVFQMTSVERRSSGVRKKALHP